MVVVHIVSGSRKGKRRTRNRRIRKRSRDEDVGLGEDFLSKLPDEILHHILSFLPTKDLVRTCVLSTRWWKVWTFFPVIDIDLGSKEMHELRNGFRALMENKMLNPSTVRIRKFHLRLAYIPSARLAYTPSADASDILLWVEKVMEHKVQELDLALPLQKIYKLPDRLFSSNSLTKLKLQMDCELTVPNSVCFPRLKILHLSLLKFSSVQSTQKLFSNCPVLEELDLDACNWSRINSIVIYVPSLRTLAIEYYHPFEDLPDIRIMVSAPNLVSFKCVSHEPMDLVLYNQSSLEDASIDVLGEEFSNPESSLQRTVKLLHGIQAVKSLTLSSYTLKALSFEKDLHDILPSFDNLKDLQVVCPSNECHSRALIGILRKTPHLQSLSMETGNERYVSTEEDGYLDAIPQCFKTSLESFYLDYLRGNKAEILLLKYFLENATLLKSMFIVFSDWLPADMKKEIRNELESSRVASTYCKIEFSDMY